VISADEKEFAREVASGEVPAAEAAATAAEPPPAEPSQRA
jgi:hypothetical protein